MSGPMLNFSHCCFARGCGLSQPRRCGQRPSRCCGQGAGARLQAAGGEALRAAGCTARCPPPQAAGGDAAHHPLSHAYIFSVLSQAVDATAIRLE